MKNEGKTGGEERNFFDTETNTEEPGRNPPSSQPQPASEPDAFPLPPIPKYRKTKKESWRSGKKEGRIRHFPERTWRNGKAEEEHKIWESKKISRPWLVLSVRLLRIPGIAHCPKIRQKNLIFCLFRFLFLHVSPLCKAEPAMTPIFISPFFVPFWMGGDCWGNHRP